MKTEHPEGEILATDDDAARLHRAVIRLARELRKTAVQETLTPAQSSVLATVVNENEIQLSELAEAESLNPTMLSRVVAFLEENDLLQREKDPIDRRAFVVRPTTQGRRMMQRLRDKRSHHLMQRMNELDEGQILQLLRALSALEALSGIEESLPE